MPAVLTSTDLPGVERVASGKVRDVYSVGGDLLIVATDRISAFDCILPQGIPGKGRVLTQMSLFWFDLLSDTVPNHLISANVDEYPAALRDFREQLEGRSMLVKRCRMEPVECVARGYVSGSGWKDYKQTGAICGIPLPPGLRESERLPEPIFTPASKAESGHDENISFEAAVKTVGARNGRAAARSDAEDLRRLPPRTPNRAASFLPIPSSNSAGTTANCCWPMKCSRPTLRATGRATGTKPGGRRNRSINSSSAITSKRSTGTSNRRRLLCRMT